jgi:hypothetical protein
MNLGISDAVDLGWKIAAVLDGWAGRELLDSYETERKPAHRLVIDTSTENVAALSDQFLAPALDDDTQEGVEQRKKAAAAVEQIKAPEFRSLGVVLGYRYSSPGICPDTATEPPDFSVTKYVPSAYPGSLAPHGWLADGSSLYDHFGKGFTLLRLGKENTTGEEAFLGAAEEAGLPVTIVAVAKEELRVLYEADYALIRPDQHIAWRGDQIIEPRKLVARVCGVAGVDRKHELAARTANQGRGS